MHGAKRKVHGAEFKAKVGLKAIYSELELVLLCRIDEPHTRRPFYGSRKMVPFLKGQGYRVNRKRVRRLRRIVGLAGMAPGRG